MTVLKPVKIFIKISLLKTLLLFCAFFCFPLFADSTHLVKKGETLYSISRQYEITVAELRAANNLSSSDIIKAGQKLVVPSADIENAALLSSNASTVAVSSAKTQTYVAKKGDTFYGIAKQYDIKVAELFALNGLGQDDVLKIGQKLKVPVHESEVASLPDLKNADPRKYTQASNVSSSLVWPVKNPKVTYVNGKVSGVQLSAAEKENVKSIMAGTVMYCGSYRGFGEVVFVQSKTGLIYAYTGLSKIKTKKGDYVVSGDVLGEAGVNSFSKEPQLTLMVFRNGSPIDPAKAPRG